MQITRSSIDTAKGPPDWFTSDVYVDAVMVHLAMQQNDESGSPVTGGRHVRDEEYAAAPTTGG